MKCCSQMKGQCCLKKSSSTIIYYHHIISLRFSYCSLCSPPPLTAPMWVHNLHILHPPFNNISFFLFVTPLEPPAFCLAKLSVFFFSILFHLLYPFSLFLFPSFSVSLHLLILCHVSLMPSSEGCILVSFLLGSL